MTRRLRVVLKRFRPRPITPHGRALEHLRTDRGFSRGHLCRRLGWERSQYDRVLKSARGPTLKTMGWLLTALDATWHDWGEVYRWR